MQDILNLFTKIFVIIWFRNFVGFIVINKNGVIDVVQLFY